MPAADMRGGAHGFALVRREQLSTLLQVTSPKGLALLVPGHGDNGFDELALKAERIKCTIAVTDSQLPRKELKDISIFSVGEAEVWQTAAGSSEFASQPTAEVAVLASAKTNFDTDAQRWADFTANLRILSSLASWCHAWPLSITAALKCMRGKSYLTLPTESSSVCLKMQC